MRLRVLHLVKTTVGGAWALRLVRELVALGVEVHVAGPGGPLAREYVNAGASFHELETTLPLRRPLAIPRVLRRYRALLARIKPDLVHSHFVATTLLMRLAGSDCPRVFQVPGPLHLEHGFFRWGELATSGEADHWIGTCELTTRLYREAGVDPARTVTIHYGLGEASFTRPAPGRLRATLGVGGDAPIALMVAYCYAPKRHLGQRRGIKGHEDFVDAIALCRGRGVNVTGVVVGGPWAGAERYYAQVEQYAAARCGDGVRMLGNRNDVPSLYVDADVAVHPSLSENLGGAGESLALGVPTIATRVGGFPDIVRDGETGWLVPPRDPMALAGAIQEALANPGEAQRRAAAGRVLVREKLPVEVTARKVLDFYRQIEKSRGRSGMGA